MPKNRALHLAPLGLVVVLALGSTVVIVAAIVSTTRTIRWSLGESDVVILATGELRGAWLQEVPLSAAGTTTNWHLPGVFQYVSSSNVGLSKMMTFNLWADAPYRQTLQLNSAAVVSGSRLHVLTIRLLAVAVLLDVIPCFVLVRALVRRRHRRRRGRCLTCGYDLTGNVSGLCPECASEVPSARTPHAEE